MIHRLILLFVLSLFISVLGFSQSTGGEYRGSIPEELLRPQLGESPNYPIDIVIGELGKGNASDAAFSFANSVAAGLLSGRMEHSGLSTINSGLREDYLGILGQINPASYRLGGGREEADGAVSFLIRFMGREQGITGELFIRFRESWVFEELILEEARTREEENSDSQRQRFDFSPYERFF
jgi:hypothetical protein